MIITGLDPGKTGALVTLYEDGSTMVDPVPLKPVERKGKKPLLKPDWRTWALMWKNSLSLNAPDVVVMEDVHGWKGQAAGASFAFGKASGFALAIVLPLPIHYAPPAVWKIKLGLVNQDKAASIALALELIPSLAPLLVPCRGVRTADQCGGIAEAGLLAYYGKMTIADTI